MPPAGASSPNAGGRFVSAPQDTSCTVHGLTSGEPVCLAKDQPDQSDVVVHSGSYAKADKLGGWAQVPVSGFGPGAVALRLGDDAGCLALEAVRTGSHASVVACSPRSAEQAFVFDAASSLLRVASDPSLCVAWGAAPPDPGSFLISTGPSGERQTIWGFGFEIQSDSIGSGNSGMPNTTSSVPHDLVPSERTRLYSSMLRGFRFCRLALGLFLRGLTPDRQNIVGRWPTQMAELKGLQDGSGIEGFDAEYWSPAPYWKSSGSYYNGTLRGFDDASLDSFADAVVRDLTYLRQQGLRTAWFGLQNEPTFHDKVIDPSSCKALGNEAMVPPPRGAANTYSRCDYTQCSYYLAFRRVAPRLLEAFPSLKIHANSARGQLGSSPVALDPVALANVSGWTWHFVGADSSAVFANTTVTNMSMGRPVWNNEYEYQPGHFRYNASTANTAAFVMNWLTFAAAPTFYWIHALKPATNVESVGYGLGIWRPPSDNTTGNWPDIAPGHWAFNGYNWNAMAPFAKFVPWDSVRLDVAEDVVRKDQRVFAFRTPTDPSAGGPLHAGSTPPGSRAFAVVNRHPSQPFVVAVRFDDHAGRNTTLFGHRFAGTETDTHLGPQTGGVFQLEVPPLAAEWWIEWEQTM